jgi:hypothetical protein
MVDTVPMVRLDGTRPGRLALLTLALGVLVAGCAGTGYHYVKSSENKAYFKIPDGWRLYSQEQILDRAKGLSPREKQAELDSTWRVVFDGAPKPALAHLFDTRSKHPTGMALVLQLSFDDSDSVSLMALRNFFFDIDGAAQNNTGEVISYESVELDGGFHGIHIVATLDDDRGRPLTINETAVLDQSTSKLYIFIVGCEATCYEDEQGSIERIVKSWTVRN